jgi:hypothetical protein
VGKKSDSPFQNGGKRKSKERMHSSRIKPLKGIARLQALELLKNPSRDHLKSFILCKLDDDCRTSQNL